jgi:hypothetical protein
MAPSRPSCTPFRAGASLVPPVGRLSWPDPPKLDDARKYLGPTLCGLCFVVHNRRTDGRVVLLHVKKLAIIARDMMEDYMLPEQKVGLERIQAGP